MNILFLIGNGFDINLGLETSYNDFYNYYVNQESKNDLIKKLKKTIKLDKNLWSDLELKFGKYTDELQNYEEFNECYNDISKNLSNFIGIKESEFKIENFDKEKLKKFLCFPENQLSERSRQNISKYRTKYVSQSISTNIITFNYTKVLENLLAFSDNPIKIGDNNYEVFLQQIQHIHGYVKERMILGVNDISQISNVEFKNVKKIQQKLLKPICNNELGHLVDENCKNLILSSHLICIFGMSFGETDKFWWEFIGNHIKNGTILIIFSKNEVEEDTSGIEKIFKEEEIRNLFISKTSLSENEKQSIEKNIFVAINSNMFDIKI